MTATLDPRTRTAELLEAAGRGTTLSLYARLAPERVLVDGPLGARSAAELDANANRLARALERAGLEAGDGFAVLVANRPEFLEAWCAAQRSGLRMTPINWHLRPEEVAYIVDDCEARALIADARFAAVARELAAVPRLELCVAAGGPVPGFEPWESVLSGESASELGHPTLGSTMLYTSGTTGRPKGVYRRDREPLLPQYEGTVSDFHPLEDCSLCTGPAYHAAPLMGIARSLVSGVPVVLMDKWDAEDTLRLIERHRITHTHMVATMFHRLLRLPAEARRRYDLSSLRVVMHGAAPCPIHVKRAMIDWLGPVLWEYYAATEGANGFLVGSEEWLTKPGTVGRPGAELSNKILDQEGHELGPNQTGLIYMKAPERGRFVYWKNPEKTARTYRGDHFTLGDMGYFDEDGYLFLTGRTAELIITGGVNVYPHEVDSALLEHPAVGDACTVGVPSDEWGEDVKSVVELRDGLAPSPELAAELLAFARERLAHFKCPRSVDFVDTLPRLPSGKIQRQRVREPYWRGRERQI
ncbi:MAG TPA: AMP-binding protein [Thermoanaerobaculia bacterium]|nr:AMP-binding protein [Thermoanaerobaculia bacterium]